MNNKSVILVVDDQPSNIKLLKAYLLPHGYEIITATNGEEAMKKISENKIDLILLDVVMSGMDGIEVTRRVRQEELYRQLPIILVTSLRETADRIRGIEAGCDDFISKPVDRFEMVARVEALLKVKAYNDLISNYRVNLESQVAARAGELKHAFESIVIANQELAFQEEEKKKLATEAVRQRDLAHIDRFNLIGNMAAGLAHEIRNPMTVVKGYLQYFKQKIPISLHDQLDLVLSELGRIETITTEFLAIAKSKPIEPEEQDLNLIIESIAPLLLTEVLQRAMTLEVKLDRDIPKLMLAEKEIKQLLLNIAINGLNAMKEHGILIIETKYQNGAVLLCIDDCGTGIPKELQKKIFDPFFTTRDEGTGLGLSVCASIVTRHNGTIDVHSEDGKGTRFIITFSV